MQLNCLVGLGRVELPTFPIYRDALANWSIQALCILVGLGRVELPTFPIYRDALASCSIQAWLFIPLISRSR